MTPEDLAFDNISAKAKALGLWVLVREVVVHEVDRFFFVGEPQMYNWLNANSVVFSRDLTSGGGPHRNIYEIFRKEITSESLKMYSYREIARPSLQVTFVRSSDAVYGDMDIDLSPPGMDVAGALIHLIEVLVPGKTDHQKLRKRLQKDKDVSKHLA